MPIKSPQSPKRTTNARFPRGVSGNPAGRPVGSRNRSTIIEEQLLTHQEALIGKAIEMALKGDAVALRLCLERIYPVPRERRIDLALPEVRNAAEATTAISTILSGIGDGQITPGEGEILAAVVETQQRLVEARDREQSRKELEQQNQKLEDALANKLRGLSAPPPETPSLTALEVQ